MTQQIIWIVGVNQGIGLALTESMLAKGYDVIGLDRDLDNISKIIKHPKLSLYLCDVTSEEQIGALCEQLLPTHPPLYVAYVAGVMYTDKHEDITSQQWREMFAINVDAVFYFMYYLIPHFRQQQQGSIVIVSSNAGRTPRVGMAAYGATKAALTHFAKYNVRVNIVSPGSTMTPMLTSLWDNCLDSEANIRYTINGDHANYKVGIPLKKLANPKDIVNAIIFLLEPTAAHITMHDIVIDGGATLGI